MAGSNTKGFFNPNTHPLTLNISALNNTISLPPKGFVMFDGQKVNDPIFEGYVGPGMLAKETSKTPVPVIHYPRPQPIPTQPQAVGFSGSTDVPKDSQGRVDDAELLRRLPSNNSPASEQERHSPVSTYTMEEAVRLRIIRPMVVPVDEGIPADKEINGPTRTLPTMEIPRVATPKEAKRLAEQGKAFIEVSPVDESKLKPVPLAPGRLPSPEPNKAPEPVSTVVETTETEKIDIVAAQAFNLPNPDEIDLDELPNDDVISNHDKQEVSEEETQKLLSPVKSSAIPPVTKGIEYVCSEDGKTFKKRGFLLQHAKKKFPDKIAQIMAPYPA